MKAMSRSSKKTIDHCIAGNITISSLCWPLMKFDKYVSINHVYHVVVLHDAIIEFVLADVENDHVGIVTPSVGEPKNEMLWKSQCAVTQICCVNFAFA